MDQSSRQIIGFSVHPGILNGPYICHMFNKIISGKSLPKYISTDHDPLFRFHRWRANLRIREIHTPRAQARIISGKKSPKYLSSDNDPLFQYHRWKANLSILDIDEIKSLPCIPVSHPYVERLIRTIRNDLTDRILFWNKYDLERKLTRYMYFYNNERSHMSLNSKVPNQIATNSQKQIISIDKYRWENHCNGLFQLPIAA